MIRLALAHERTLGIAYGGYARVVDPVEVDGVHLRAWCLHREAYRRFRLDRIDVACIGPRIEDLGPELGDPVEIQDAPDHP